MKTISISGRTVITLVVLFLMANLLVSALGTYAASQKPEVVVEVYVNNHDEDYIADIEFDDGTRVGDFRYEIRYVVLPRSYALGQYFDYAAWIMRDDGVTLSLDPKDNVRSSSSLKEIAWNCLASRETGLSSSGYWDNETCMKWQYDCHFNVVPFKDYWNIEPWRTASSYVEVLLGACNPR